MYKFLLPLLLLTPSLMYADVIFPAMFFYGGLFSTVFIFVGVAIEALCLYAAVREKLLKVVLVTVLMNAASAFLGVIGLILHDVLLYLSQLMEPLVLFNRYGYIVSAALIGIVLNVIIELPITVLFFPKVSVKKLFMWVTLGNILSVLIGLFGFAYFSPQQWRNLVPTAEWVQNMKNKKAGIILIDTKTYLAP